MGDYDLHLKAAALVRDAGNRLVGRTRLQKVTYLSQLAGFAEDFRFGYRHYGCYSEDLAEAMDIASGLGVVNEEEKRSEWGGWYSIYTVDPAKTLDVEGHSERSHFLSEAAKMGVIELELAATAAFLHDVEGFGRHEGKPDAWAETAMRKPGKAADGRLELAKTSYRRLRELRTPKQLPDI